MTFPAAIPVESFVAALVAYLVSRDPVYALVRDRVSDRWAPQEEPHPRVIVTRVANRRLHHLNGTLAMRNPLVQVDVIARTAEEADTVGEVVAAALDGYHGPMGALDVRRAWVRGDADDTEAANDGSEGALFRKRMDVSLWHTT